MKTTVDMNAARELVLFAENDGRTYRQITTPVITNMKRKIKSGTFDENKAVKAFEYVAEFAAKAYCKEFCSPRTAWHTVFNAATRRAAAAELLAGYMEEITYNEEVA